MEQNSNVETPNISLDTWQSTLFGGKVQPGKPNSEGENLPGGNRDSEREYHRARQVKARKKAKNKRLIQAFVEQTGFYGFYQSHRIQVHYDSHVWDSPTYGRAYYQEAAKVLFAGYIPTIRDILLLLVVRISNATGRAPLPFVNYLTTTYTRGLEEVRGYMGKMGVLERGDATR